MSAMKRKATSASARRRPALRQRFGQHHLRDPRLCMPLIDFLQPAGRTTIEIGSGGGVLTAALAAAAARVVGIDVDLAWSLEARRRLAGRAASPVRWLVADATEFGWSGVDSNWLVCGNLPYNVATPIVRKVLEQSATPRMCFLVQKEVAERMAAGPGSRRYGVLSLLVSWWAEASLLDVVKPGGFEPPPKVQSQFVGLQRRPEAAAAEEYRKVMSIAETAFTHRRKTLANALRGRFDRVQTVDWCRRAGLSSSVRPEQLSLQHFRSLASALEAAKAASV